MRNTLAFATFICAFVPFALAAGTTHIIPCDGYCPLSDMARAMQNVTSGDRIVLRGGTWINCSSAAPILLPAVSLVGEGSVRFECDQTQIEHLFTVHACGLVTLANISFYASGTVVKSACVNAVESSIVVKNCSFTNLVNAVFLGGHISVSDSIFVNGSAGIGWVNCWPDIVIGGDVVTIDRSIFIDNGGCQGSLIAGKYITVRDSIFVGSTESPHPTATSSMILSASAGLTVVGSTFSAFACTGNCLSTPSTGSNMIADCAFLNVTAASILWAGSAVVLHTTFTDYSGGGILASQTSVVVHRCSFTNIASIAISATDVTITDSVFTNLYHPRAEIIQLWPQETSLRIERSLFRNNNGVIRCSGNATIMRSDFIANQDLEFDFGPTYIYDSTFTENKAQNMIQTSKLLVVSSRFLNNSGSTISDQGGVVMYVGYGTIMGCVFDSNSALPNQLATTGGCIFFDGGDAGVNLIINSTFVNNFAQSGGAIVATGPVTIINSTFSSNTAIQVGGSVYMVQGNLVVEQTYFSANSAAHGGAIYSCDFVQISQSFIMNNVGVLGGAIWFSPKLHSAFLNASDNLFLANSVMDYGGAIYLGGGASLLVNNQFFSNSARGLGGAIHMDIGSTLSATDCLTVVACDFVQNVAGIGGGAVSFWAGFATISGSNFQRNAAMLLGGSILTACATLAVDQSSFIDNAAGNDSSILHPSGIECSESRQSAPFCVTCQTMSSFDGLPCVSSCAFAPGIPWSFGDGAGNVTASTSGDIQLASLCNAPACTLPVVSDANAIVCQPSTQLRCTPSCKTNFKLLNSSLLLSCGENLTTPLCTPHGNDQRRMLLILVIGGASLVTCLLVMLTVWAYRQRRLCFAARDYDYHQGYDFRQPRFSSQANVARLPTMLINDEAAREVAPLMPSSAVPSTLIAGSHATRPIE